MHDYGPVSKGIAGVKTKVEKCLHKELGKIFRRLAYDQIWANLLPERQRKMWSVKFS